MGLEINTLPLMDMHTNLHCIRPGPDKNPVTEDSPAITVMTDFTSVTPVTVEPFTSLDTALDRMKTMGVRLLLITDEHDDIQGMITSYDLTGEKPVKYTEDTGIKHRDITVLMIMTPISDTPAVDLDYVNRAQVRHVINTLKELDRPHILVVEKNEKGKNTIRGLFSSSNIGKILGRRVYEPLHASRSLAEITRSME